MATGGYPCGDRLAEDNIIDIYTVLSVQMVGSSYLTADSGYFGRAPNGVQEGDLICILFGCPMPAILRPDGDTHRLVEIACVHGIMDGEFVANSAKLQRQQFALRQRHVARSD